MPHSGPTKREKGKWLPVLIFNLGDFDKSISGYSSADDLGFHWSKQSGDTDAFPVVRPSPKCQEEKGLSKATLSSPDCGHLLQREEEAMAACWVPVHHCCVFCPERETFTSLVLNESPSLICHWHRSFCGFNLSTWQPTVLFSVYVFPETSGLCTFCSVQVKATIQKLAGTWQCSSSWSYTSTFL